jgi:expansin (peptidoglycan-binding protein)
MYVVFHHEAIFPSADITCKVCNGPTKCVFVRVVDSCAGCAAGSQAVDLTKAAFSQLADINEGRLEVQMRSATTPRQW